MSLPGSASPNWFCSWLTVIVNQLLVGADAAPPVAFDGVAYKSSNTTPPDELFALYVGSQHLNAWTGAQVCVIVPSFGAEARPVSFRTTGPRMVLDAVSLGIDVHIWGKEPSAEDVDRETVYWDIARMHAAEQIYQNVRRAIHWASSRFLLTVASVDGWNNESQLRHGEAFLERLAVSFPIYDYAHTAIPTPQVIQQSVTIKAPGE